MRWLVVCYVLKVAKFALTGLTFRAGSTDNVEGAVKQSLKLELLAQPDLRLQRCSREELRILLSSSGFFDVRRLRMKLKDIAM